MSRRMWDKVGGLTGHHWRGALNRATEVSRSAGAWAATRWARGDIPGDSPAETLRGPTLALRSARGRGDA